MKRALQAVLFVLVAGTVFGNIPRNRVWGLVQRAVRAGTATNEWSYDGRGFPASHVQYSATADYASADPAVTNFYVYNERGELIQTTNALGWKTAMAYDPLGRPEWREVYDQTGAALFRQYTYYNGNGEVTWIEGPRSNPEDYVWRGYDRAGRLTTEVRWRSRARSDGSGVEAETGDDLYAITFHAYDGFGNETNSIFPLGNSATMQWDALGRKTSEVFYSAGGAALATNCFSCEPGGQVAIAFNALGAGTTNIYNVAGKLVGRYNADGSTNAWRYDLAGRVVKMWQPIAGLGPSISRSGPEQLHVTSRSRDAGTAFTYHSERFNARATHIQHCPREPREVHPAQRPMVSPC